jgi:hypothetical protein
MQITISTYGKNSYSTTITIGPSLMGLRGTQLTGSINYTLVSYLPRVLFFNDFELRAESGNQVFSNEALRSIAEVFLNKALYYIQMSF